RIIRLHDRHMDQDMEKWMGDSIGHFDGDELVVTTTSFNPKQSFYGTTPDAVITERFRLAGDIKIEYRFTIDDPAVYTEPWSGEVAMYRRPEGEKLYEYACHEGNYALPGVLAGARQAERDAVKE